MTDFNERAIPPDLIFLRQVCDVCQVAEATILIKEMPYSWWGLERGDWVTLCPNDWRALQAHDAKEIP